MLKTRSKDKEIIDLGQAHYTQKEYADCLAKLDRVGRLLGGYRTTLKALNAMHPPPASILDVGCGGGYFVRLLGRRYTTAKIVGIDINPLAIEHAQALDVPSNVSFELKDDPVLHEQAKSYDVVTCMLVCHHLSDEEIIDFIQRACQVAKKRVIINDLQRSALAYFLFKGISPFLFRNRLVMHDGPLSVARSFTRKDWERYLDACAIPKQNRTITWRWGFRYCVEILTD